MIIFFLAAMLFNFGLFDKDLNDCKDEVLRNSVVIVLDEVSCSSCFFTLLSVSHIWSKDFATTVVFKCPRDRVATRRLLNAIKDFKMIDNVYFYRKSRLDRFPAYNFGGHEFHLSPNVIIDRGGVKEIVSYKELFEEKFDSTSVKKQLLKYLK